MRIKYIIDENKMPRLNHKLRTLLHEEVDELLQVFSQIKKVRLVTNAELAKDLGISYNTFLRISSPGDRLIALKTKRKIRNFIIKHKTVWG